MAYLPALDRGPVMEPKYKVGNVVYRATYGKTETWITCPDCGGTKRVTVILHDGTEIKIECGGCNPGGYEGSRGIIRQYEWKPEAQKHTVTGFKVSSHDGVEYELDRRGGDVVSSYWTGNEETVFATEQEAIAASEALRVEHEAEENKHYLAKTKDHKSWAWNASYHRREIKELERRLEYHRGKSEICKAKSKAAQDCEVTP